MLNFSECAHRPPLNYPINLFRAKAPGSEKFAENCQIDEKYVLGLLELPLKYLLVNLQPVWSADRSDDSRLLFGQ